MKTTILLPTPFRGFPVRKAPSGLLLAAATLLAAAPQIHAQGVDLALREAEVEDSAIGNANGIAEPGETVWVSFVVANEGDDDATGVAGAVRCATPGVTLAQSPAAVSYGDIASGADANGSPRLLVAIADTVDPGTVVRLAQTITDDSGESWNVESSFIVQTAEPSPVAETAPFTAYTMAGVTNAFGAFLKGDGQDGSYVFQLIATTAADGTVSEPRASDGMPSGGERVLATTSGLYVGCFGNAAAVDLGRFRDTFVVPVTDEDLWVVVRAWSGPFVGGGIWYGDSEPYKLTYTEGESHDFGQWCVGTIFNYPAEHGTEPVDTNGDGIPDGYVLENFPGVDPTVDPTDANKMEFLGKIAPGGSTDYFPYRVFATDTYVYSLNGHQKSIGVWTTNGVNGTLVGVFRPTALQLQEPIGMGRQPGANRFAVADKGSGRIHVFDFDESNMSKGNVVAGFTSVLSIDGSIVPEGDGGPLVAPQGVAMDAAGVIYVVDTGSDNSLSARRVLVFNADGTFRNAYQPDNEYVLVDPAGIDVDPDSGDIYVANTGAGNIVHLSSTGDPIGVYSNEIATTTYKPVVERVTYTVTTNKTKKLVSNNPVTYELVDTVVTNYLSKPYYVTNGWQIVTKVASVPVGPTDVKVWKVGSSFRLLVADRDGNAIHVLDSTGKVVASFSNPLDSTIYSRNGMLRMPWGVYPLADSDEVWVADTRNNRLQHFRFALDGNGDGLDDTQQMLDGKDPVVPNDVDSDDDGLADAAEILIGTNPDVPDTDGGGVKDGAEVAAGLDPLDASDDTGSVTLTVTALPAEGGSVLGSGAYEIGSSLGIEATPAKGWLFAGWQDNGSTDSPRVVTVAASGNAYTALFERESHLVVVNYVTKSNTPSDIVPDGTQTNMSYYGIAFRQDDTSLFVDPYSFLEGSDTLSNVYATPVVEFADGAPSDVTVTFVVEKRSETDPSDLPTITATAIAVDGTTLTASFTTDATEEAQYGTYMNDARTSTVLLVADTLDALSDFLAWRAANPDASRSTYTGTVYELSAAVTKTSDTAPFTFSIEADLTDWATAHDSLFIIGFDKP